MNPTKEKEDHEHADLNKKMKLVTNVLNAVEIERKRGWNIDFSNEYERCFGYLCYKDQEFYKTIASKVNPVKTYLQFTKERNVPMPLNYWFMRDIIYEHYKTNIIPTRWVVTRALKENNHDIGGHDEFDNLLNQSGFTWRQLPNTSKAIIVEKEEHAFKRQRYLQKIKQYRKSNKQIIFIERISLREPLLRGNREKRQEILIAASPQFGLKNICFISGLDEEKKMEEWIFDIVIYDLQPSIIVYEETWDRTSDCIPTGYDSKNEMIKWLERNNIPCNRDLNRFELYDLINNFTPKPDPLYYIEQHLKNFGHEVLRAPAQLEVLSYFYNIWDKFKNIDKPLDNLQNCIKKFVNKYSISEWKSLEDDLIIREEKIYAEDMKVEELTDKLLTVAKYMRDDLKEEELHILEDFQPDDLNDIIIA